LRIVVTVSPRAARTELVCRHGEGWKVRVAAPPEGGRANKALVQLLAEVLGLPQAGVRIVGGGTTRRKVVEVEGLEQEEVERRLDAAVHS
jgi:uncharacterized protein (TIGR00251 family)